MKTLSSLRRFLLVLTALLSCIVSVQGAVFSSDTHIGISDLGYEGEALIVSNCTLTVDGRHSFAGLQLVSGALLTHTWVSSGVLQTQLVTTTESLILSGTNAVALSHSSVVLSNVNVTDATGLISYTNGLDYNLTQDSGFTMLSRTDASTIPDGATVLAAYSYIDYVSAGTTLTISGDVDIAPGTAISVDGRGFGSDLGPGAGGTGSGTGGGGGLGGCGSASLSNAPGGACYGSVELPAELGSGGGSSYAGPGASGGGSIKIQAAGTFRNNGLISANGNAATNSRAGGGAGGSIWLSAATFSGGGTISADGGAGEPSIGGGGGGGRVALYFNTNTFTGPVHAHGGRGPLFGGAGTIYLHTNSAAYAFLDVENGGHPSTNTIVAARSTPLVSVHDGATLSILTPSTFQGVTVGAGSSLSLGTAEPVSVSTDLVVAEGGSISADGLGYANGGPGTGGNYFYGSTAGAGYGGFGGLSISNTARGNCYGSFQRPQDWGSGGGVYDGGAAGGGAIHLVVAGTIQLGGRISANGRAPTRDGAGGASGGSVWLTAQTLTGSGQISAIGSLGRSGGGSGGGGRIALYIQTNTFAGSIQARGAGAGSTAGGPGSIYTEFGSAAGQLLFDNGGQQGLSTVSLVSPLVGLTLQNGAMVGANLSLNVSNLWVGSNSWLLVTNAYPVLVSGDALIEQGGGISSDGLGFAPGQGPGAGRTLVTNISGAFYIGTGGGHGGYGAAASVGGISGGVYDSINAPSVAGSGGGQSTGQPIGGYGGGVAIVIVSNRLTLDGRISADGFAATNANGGGGSGGTIRITASQFEGTGIVSARGGAGRDLGGSGAGGRIAIFSPTNLFSGTLMAYGGGTSNIGGAGTIYLKPDASMFSSVPGAVIVDNGGQMGTNTDAAIIFSLSDLTVKGGAVANVGTSLSSGSLFVGSNSWVRAAGPTCSINLSGNATVEAGGGIRSAGTGTGTYPYGSGAGRSGYLGNVMTGGGGGFGGGGGSGAGLSALGGNCYDFAASQQSSAYGSRGAEAFASAGGAGGGGIFLITPGTLQLDGSIIADGLSGSGTNSGGGSGGSIRISAGTFKGSGLLSANGGRGPGLGGGGGGGRIYVLNYGNSRSNLFTGALTAYGGEGFNRGGAGTIYLQSSNLVLVDNHGSIGTNTVLNDNGGFDVLIQNGGVMSIGNLYSSGAFRNLTIASNGWLLATRSLNLSGDVLVQSGGGMIADKLGYGPDQGPGAGRASSGGVHGGGGHGGVGGGNAPQYGVAYDDFSHPTQGGSGGSSGSGSTFAPLGGAGGGVVNLTLAQRGILRVDGIISANGGGGDINSGGGAGGSVAIYASTLMGTGAIVANGGAGNASGGGGGGGLVMIYPATNLFTGSLAAKGGNGVAPGGAGIVYVHTPSQAGNIVLDNAGLRGPGTPFYNRLGPVVDLSVKNGGALAIIGQNILRNLDVLSGATVLFSSDSYASLTLNGNARISADSSINADGKGYGAGSGPGAGGAIGSTGGTVGGGGAHVGAGAGPRGGAPYDSITTPRQAGSGGGPGTGGYGGGVVTLTVNGTLQNDGRISADGISGTLLSGGGGGGAGGTVILWAGTLSGSGSITANGGAGNGLGGGGGGGCISIGCSSNQFSGPITALGGGGSAIGGAGTIYLPDPSGQGGVVLLDNGGQAGTNTQLNLPWPLDLRIQNGAIGYEGVYGYLLVSNLTIAAGGTLTCWQGQTNITATVLKDAIVETNGLITADAVAFGGDGQGLSTNSIGSGAGHGGNGGASSLSPGGLSYGSELRPLEAGSSGGEGFPSYLLDAAGGGVIRLNVGGSLSNNGLITANGGPGLQDNSGGGSGGAILIQATTIAGTGGITAKGGAGELFEGGGGGGGRIAIYSHTNIFGGFTTATGAEGWTFGEDGSVYLGTIFEPLVVLSHTPSGVTTNSVDVIKLELSNPPILATADIGKFSLIDPNGGVLTNFALLRAGVSSIAVSVPTLSTVGDYTITIQPGLVSDVFGQQLSQSYTGTFHITLPLISGVITNLEGQPLPGILVQTSIGSPAITDANGAYAIGAVPGQFITLTPTAPGLFFVPADRTYFSVNTNIPDESYLAVTSLNPTLSYEQQGTNLVLNWTSLPGVTYQVFSSSDLSQWLPFSDLMPGSGGPLRYVVTIGNDPALFFRLEVLR